MTPENLLPFMILHLGLFAAAGLYWIWPRKELVTGRSGQSGSGIRSGSDGGMGYARVEILGPDDGDGSDADADPEPMRPAAELPSAEALATRRTLTAGPGFDIRQIDPESVELSTDDMLNPLQSIAELIERIREEGELSANQRRYLGAALAKSRRMISHIEDIDLMIRLQQGNVGLKERSFSLTEKLARLARVATSAMEDRSVEVRHDFLDGKPYLISIDEQLLEKLLGQLMNAAIRVAPDDAVIELTESTEEVESAVSGSEFFFLEDEDLAVQEQRRIEIVFSMPKVSAEDRLNYLTHAVAHSPETALVLRQVTPERSLRQDLFGLTLARNIARKLGAELVYDPDRKGRTVFILTFEAECIATGKDGSRKAIGDASSGKN